MAQYIVFEQDEDIQYIEYAVDFYFLGEYTEKKSSV